MEPEAAAGSYASAATPNSRVTVLVSTAPWKGTTLGLGVGVGLRLGLGVGVGVRIRANPNPKPNLGGDDVDVDGSGRHGLDRPSGEAQAGGHLVRVRARARVGVRVRDGVRVRGLATPNP